MGWLALLGLALVAAASAARAAPPSVILISLDGTTPGMLERWLEREELAALRCLGEKGATGRLAPVFPTNTFPNHVTFVTGVAPERHGIVNNVFVDPERGVYRYEADPTWIEVEPLWSLLAARGLPAAAFHWVGSEGSWRSGRGPRHWRPFDAAVMEHEKVRQILAWLELADAAERPRLVTSWFRGADRAAHGLGPDSGLVRVHLHPQDRALRELVYGLARRQLWTSTTLLVVSDHGMAPVQGVVDLARALEASGVAARVLGGGGFATLHAASREEALRAVEVARRLGLEAHLREQAPPGWRVAHARFGDAVVLAPLGTAIVRSGEGDARPASGVLDPPRGAHGYLPDAPGMDGIFLAFGRGVPPGARLGRVSALAVTPTVLALLDVPAPAWMEGRAVAALGAAESPRRGPDPHDRCERLLLGPPEQPEGGAHALH